jgi:hypothetical protein
MIILPIEMRRKLSSPIGPCLEQKLKNCFENAGITGQYIVKYWVEILKTTHEMDLKWHKIFSVTT